MHKSPQTKLLKNVMSAKDLSENSKNFNRRESKISTVDEFGSALKKVYGSTHVEPDTGTYLPISTLVLVKCLAYRSVDPLDVCMYGTFMVCE